MDGHAAAVAGEGLVVQDASRLVRSVLVGQHDSRDRLAGVAAPDDELERAQAPAAVSVPRGTTMTWNSELDASRPLRATSRLLQAAI